MYTQQLRQKLCSDLTYLHKRTYGYSVYMHICTSTTETKYATYAKSILSIRNQSTVDSRQSTSQYCTGCLGNGFPYCAQAVRERVRRVNWLYSNVNYTRRVLIVIFDVRAPHRK